MQFANQVKKTNFGLSKLYYVDITFLMEIFNPSQLLRVSDENEFMLRDDYKDRDYRRSSPSRSRGRSERESHRARHKDYPPRSRSRSRSQSRSASPGYRRERGRGKYDDDERRRRSRSYGRYSLN